MADDRDIKIYVKNSADDAADFKNLTQDIQRHITNGNKDKAVRLGVRMAKIKAEDNVVDLTDFRFSAAQLYHVRVLLTFVAEYAVQNNISDEFLADTVSSSLYGYLKENEPGYYDNISDGGAFSFYLLALKKDGGTARNVGEQFAMLCAINKAEIIDLGAEIFTKGAEYFADMIRSADFEN